MSFSYPSGWKPQYAGRPMGLRPDLIVALSTQRLRAPCRWIDAHSVTCGTPLMLNTLPRGGVFVVWTRNWSLGGPVPLPSGSGSKTRIGGKPATVALKRGVRVAEPCSSLGETESITANVAEGFEMDACARGVNFTRFEGQVRATLESVSFRN